MSYEHVRAGDDGVSYEDGDVVYGGQQVEDSSTSREIVNSFSSLLCGDFGPEDYEKLQDQHRDKDSDCAEQTEIVGRTISDVDEFLGSNYPTYLS